MKSTFIGLLCLVSFNLSAKVSLRLGALVPFASDEITNYQIESVRADVGASTDVSPSIAWKGCYAEKVDTGQGFPYRFNYVPMNANRSIPFTIEGQTIVLEDFEALRKAAKKEVKKEARFYCKKETTVSIVFKVSFNESETATASFTLSKNRKGYFIEK
ncbi:MAG: hypothetical protein HOM21_13380, partial [Halobacteriovoraceae bacterium]|nr:hypothetical protein [Halobacteriovoraceae bacterium]